MAAAGLRSWSQPHLPRSVQFLGELITEEGYSPE